MRQLKVRMLDGTVKTMLVDDSQPVTNLMVVICTKIGKQNCKVYFCFKIIGKSFLTFNFNFKFESCIND